MAYWSYDDVFGAPLTAAQRKSRAAAEVAKLKKSGRTLSPIAIQGRTIARTFWGKAWCQNLERYSDIESRLGRGRSYVRSGSVLHLEIAHGRVEALVQGTRLYDVTITVKPVDEARYGVVIAACAGKVSSVIELLQGKLPAAVMEVITGAEHGLFPEPPQIGMKCSCPDGARMCKHVAAVLYGIGARFDAAPELLFALRAADPRELVASAASRTVTGASDVSEEKVLDGDLGSLFGIELDAGPDEETAMPPARAPVAKKAHAKRAASAKTTSVKTAAPAKQEKRASKAPRKKKPATG